VDSPTGREIGVVYSVLDLGRERILARYLGTAEAVALNRSILEASLASLEVEPLLTAELTAGIQPRWGTAAIRTGGPTLSVPEGWLLEAGGPSPCGGLGEPADALTASPSGDYTVQLRAAWRPKVSVDLAKAAEACAPRLGRSGDASYSSTADWWGTTYGVEGVFVATADGVWHLEVAAPTAKSAAAAAVFRAWVDAIASAR
jgi:hypothetical protein